MNPLQKKRKRMSEKKKDSLAEMDLLAHLNELRTRLIRSIIYIILGMTAAYIFKQKILDLVLYPIMRLNPDISRHLVFISPTEGFLTFIRLSAYASLIFTAPLILWEFWLFAKPALYRKEQKTSFRFFMISLLLFYFGLFLAYILVIPYGFSFLMGFAGEQMVPMISIREFVIFVFKVLIIFGAIFETPLILFLLSLFGIINSGMLSRLRRYVIILIFIISALITPPDPITQILLAIPLVVLYEISIIVIKIGEKKN